ncbi:MAG TPA: T9SS type A sorting domain-containing protein [Bacteroidia bacterium]|jgi:hypothetical protein|nr:T9SS type A sorting domain-containing protein [Bacteroidia bacterium]
MKKIIALLFMFFCLNTKAQTWVTIPDANFVAYLQGHIPTAMSGNQMNTNSNLVTTTTHSINVAGLSISDLSGIQYFTSLTYLECNSNSLTHFPALPNLLTTLICNINYLTSLPTLPNSLTTLICNSNSLTSLPALPNSLNYLDCSYNNIITLPTLPNSLQVLYCYYDSLTSLPALPNSITRLDCYNNKIACFPHFPNIAYDLEIDPNPYNCLPNYISVMSATDLAKPLCTAGNTNGCAVAGIEHYTNSIQASIYPNPTSTNFIIETASTDKQTLQIFDVNGKLVLSQIINGKTNIDATNLAEGVYNLSLMNQNGVVNKRLVIVR